MALDPSVFEKLGAFYLGRSYDGATKAAGDVPVLYDSRDLVTHAVCVGMTGSGKTGLCLALLEEAGIDGIPAIIIDPKGDLGNLLLTFPDLRPEDFRPWVNADDARRKGMEPDDYAKREAEAWRKGLAVWGEGPDRIRALRERVDMAIYTPGSTSGIPVNVLASFEAPTSGDSEAIADRVQTTASSLLGLLKLNADPVKSREYILLSAILAHEWQNGCDLALPTLIERIQNPPFQKIGVLDLETFYPAKDRFALVMAVNNMLAAPGFASWRQGESLDAGKLLYTPEGKPCLAIFSIAHLSDEERMFFVSLLLNEVLSWTRAQSGTTSLRAILYMDEIFGYLPPTANPPSKLPLLTLLKQARAFGVGIVLATQNPVDLDYKALSNAGTWFIGRLQTERDKARVLDGLQGASAGGKFDPQAIKRLLAGLGNRVFLMNNVHDDGPAVFETRWAMSYL
ncbi:MAG TPA: ATP-binding protein, partial [Terrimicrobiaceae bacterium]|nr:ATP-binding protein [Terrimicrobiaceae bacterium]